MVYELTYFHLPGRGEVIRLMLTLGDLQFEDKRISFKEWPQKKSGAPWGTVPMLKLPDGTLKVLVEGQNRCKLLEVKDDGNFIESSVEALACPKDVSEETGVLVRSTKALFEQYVNLNKKIPVEVVSTLSEKVFLSWALLLD